MKITCCKGCQGRYVGCHSECEEYIEQKARLEKHKEVQRRESEARRYRNDLMGNIMAGHAARNGGHRANADKLYKRGSK